jgi:hypothetical protein
MITALGVQHESRDTLSSTIGRAVGGSYNLAGSVLGQDVGKSLTGCDIISECYPVLTLEGAKRNSWGVLYETKCYQKSPIGTYLGTGPESFFIKL